jgi:hypothetical protein
LTASRKTRKSFPFIFASTVCFVAAVVFAAVENLGLFVSLGLVVFGGFLMLIPRIRSDRVQPQKAEEHELLA